MVLKPEDWEPFLAIQCWHLMSFSMQMPTQISIHYRIHVILVQIRNGNIYVLVCIWWLYSADAVTSGCWFILFMRRWKQSCLYESLVKVRLLIFRTLGPEPPLGRKSNLSVAVFFSHQLMPLLLMSISSFPIQLFDPGSWPNRFLPLNEWSASLTLFWIHPSCFTSTTLHSMVFNFICFYDSYSTVMIMEATCLIDTKFDLSGLTLVSES